MGSLVTALASFLYIKSKGGLWHVRIDDIDPPRQDPNAIDQILSSLSAHGLHSDGPVDFQSTHTQAYADALDALKDCIFYCRCSRRSLADLPIYPGTCRDQKTPQKGMNYFFDTWQVYGSWLHHWTANMKWEYAT